MNGKPTEIEFKFKISIENILKAICRVNRDEQFIIVPKFEVYNDQYFQKDKIPGFLRKRTVMTFKNRDNSKTNKNNNYPRPELSPEQNYLEFLKCGMSMFSRDNKSFIFDIKTIETYYTLKRKKIIEGVENNEEIEIRANSNGNRFMFKMIEDNNYQQYFTKAKRKAFVIEPIGEGILMFPGCHVEIVAVSENNSDIITDFYAEVEFADSRVVMKDEHYKKLTHESIMNSLNMLPYLIFGIPYEEIVIDPRSWDEIIKQQKTYKIFDDIDLGEINGQ